MAERYIYNEVENVKNKYYTNDPFEIIKNEGIILKFNYYFQDIKGFYFITNGIRYICINGNEDETTQRIVAAHELGHDMLHHDWVKCFSMHDISIFANGLQVEREANEFAANLLLSDNLVWNEYINDELLYEDSCFNIYPKPLLYYKLLDMKRRGYNFPDNLIENLKSS